MVIVFYGYHPTALNLNPIEKKWAQVKFLRQGWMENEWWCVRKYAEEIKEGDSQSKMIYLRL